MTQLLALDRLTLAELAPMMRAVVRDQSYRATPVGTMVGRYIRWLRNEYGATSSTIRDYEAVLARMSIALAVAAAVVAFVLWMELWP